MQQINIDELKPHPRNNEFFSDMTGEKWNEFLDSIKTRGIIEPIVITSEKVIVSGHQRVRACKKLGIRSVMCDVHTYNNDDESIFINTTLYNASRIKDIPSKIQRIRILASIDELFTERKKKIKQQRNLLVLEYRKEIAKYKKSILDLRMNQCELCGFDLLDLLEIHHVLPLQQGGDNSLENILCLCPTCHRIVHKYISSLQNNNVDIDSIGDWFKNHYSYNAYEKLMDFYKKYIQRESKYRWKELKELTLEDLFIIDTKTM